MYNRDEHRRIDLYPLLEGASVSGIILKYRFDDGEHYIKVKNTSLADYSIKSHLICQGLSDTIEVTGEDIKFRSILTYFTQPYLDLFTDNDVNAAVLEQMNIQLSNSVELKNLKWGDKTYSPQYSIPAPDRSFSNLKNLSQPLIMFGGQSALMGKEIETEALKGN